MKETKIILLDDDLNFHAKVKKLVDKTPELTVMMFPNPDAFMEHEGIENILKQADILILDYFLGGLTSPATSKKIKVVRYIEPYFKGELFICSSDMVAKEFADLVSAGFVYKPQFTSFFSQWVENLKDA